MASMNTFFLFIIFLRSDVGAKQNYNSKISLGSSLVPTSQSSYWLSPSGRFAFGFYRQSGGYSVGIWLVGKPNSTVVWTANRDLLPVQSGSSLSLTDKGKLILETEVGQKILLANTTEAASFASIHDSGNFVLYNHANAVIWDSFRYPSDTILGGQNLSTGSHLVSSLSDTNQSPGRFHLKMQDDGNLVLYPMGTGDTPGDAYWSSSTIGGSSRFYLYLNDTGILSIVNGTDLDTIETLARADTSSESEDFTSSLNSGKGKTIYRATLDVDGVLRLYSHKFDGNGEFNVTEEWAALNDPCEVKGFCGFNSFCTFNDNEPYCQCLPGSDFIDPDQKPLGCQKNYTKDECRDGNDISYLFDITRMKNLMWGDRPYTEERLSMEECSKSCLEDCNCGGALFEDGTCKKQNLPLRYVRRIPQGSTRKSNTAFLKVGIPIEDERNKTIPKDPAIVVRNQNSMMKILLVTFGLIIISCVSLIIAGLFVYKFRVLRYERLLQNRNVGLPEELTLRLFSYRELKRATNSFREELGKGSFGAVYKGSFFKGKKLIAVKRLEKLVEDGEREFRAEMQAIGRTHHRNLVRLLGYCAVDSKRLLVYEYMSNGSLADLLFKSKRRPDWNERARIALDVARGILYLHEGCKAPIIHCDIKPQNILMDDFWTAKISDFGLAKLLMPDQTRTFTGVRGTRGYLAPEWHKNVPITVKADIFSYGIVLLEIVCCRRNMEISVSKPEEIVLSNWVYNCFVAGDLEKLVIGEEVDKKILDRLVKVALWCIQDEPAFRPSMKSVVLMLEGITETSIPPCPTESPR